MDSLHDSNCLINCPQQKWFASLTLARVGHLQWLARVEGFADWGQLKWFGSQAPVTIEGDTLDCRLVWKGRGVGVGMIPIDVLCDL